MSSLPNVAAIARVTLLLSVAALPAPSLPGNHQNRAKEQNPISSGTEPTLEETRRFLLTNTRREWLENPGNRHHYTLTIANKRLKYTHKFTSDFVASYEEKAEVALSDLDPTLVGKPDPALPLISLATANGGRKVAVEVRKFRPFPGAPDRKFTDSILWIPGSAQPTEETQEKMDARLKKAWAHLIKLSGGKPGKPEPF